MNNRNVSLPRRGLLLGLAVAGASLGLAGCGFELRKAPVFAFKSLSVEGSEALLKSAMINQIRRELRATGSVTVLPAEDASKADVILEILGEDRNRIVISTNSAGLVRELQLQLRIRFRLRTPGGKDLLPASEVSQTRDLSFNETNALAKEGEADLLFRDMQSDIAQQLMRRIAAKGLKPLYTIHGDEPLLAQEAADAIRTAARAQGYTERSSYTVAGAHFDWGEVLASGGSMSLFSDKQLIEIRIPSGKPGKDGSQALQQIAIQLSPPALDGDVTMPSSGATSQTFPPTAEWLDQPDIAPLAVSARRYGFHATLKAPFPLAKGKTEAELVDAFITFAATIEPFEIDEIVLGRLGNFFALVPGGPSQPLKDLAQECVA
eukprot:gene41896-55593_t